jgi:hypothetical protein
LLHSLQANRRGTTGNIFPRRIAAAFFAAAMILYIGRARRGEGAVLAEEHE